MLSIEGYDLNPKKRDKYRVKQFEVDITERILDIVFQNKEFIQSKIEVKVYNDNSKVLYFSTNIFKQSTLDQCKEEMK